MDDCLCCPFPLLCCLCSCRWGGGADNPLPVHDLFHLTNLRCLWGGGGADELLPFLGLFHLTNQQCLFTLPTCPSYAHADEEEALMIRCLFMLGAEPITAMAPCELHTRGAASVFLNGQLLGLHRRPHKLVQAAIPDGVLRFVCWHPDQVDDPSLARSYLIKSMQNAGGVSLSS
eukprot:1160442-Pelagomonas_calceolata.AAC.5